MVGPLFGQAGTASGAVKRIAREVLDGGSGTFLDKGKEAGKEVL